MPAPDSRIVYVVDDDASLRRSLRNLLSSVGFVVETFESAEAFLEAGHRRNTGCLVLDLRMPGMGGLRLLDLLAAGDARFFPPTIVLTGHGDDDARQRSLRAGAVAFLEKPFQADVLLEVVEQAMLVTSTPAIEGGVEPEVHGEQPSGDHMGADGRPIHFAGHTLGKQCHICAFFNGAEEEHRVLRSFVKDGIDAGEKSFHIVDPDQEGNHLQWLRDEGINVEGAMASGQLEVRTWQHAHLQGDHFEKDAMLALVDEVLASNAAAGYPLTRILAHMEWALLDKPGVADLIEYESRVNHVLSKYSAPVICAYDLSKFSARVVMDVLRTHPMAIIGGVLLENPFFVPPDQLLLEIKARPSERKNAIAT